MTKLIIRPAAIDDSATIYTLIRDLALYENKGKDDTKITVDKIKQHGFGEKPYFHTLIAEYDNTPVGVGLYYFGYAGYLGAPTLFLEDLFVEPNHRNKGIGNALMAKLQKIAKENRCCRMEWCVFDWNKKAIDFYQSLGAELKHQLILIRLATM